ncbi:hypothetical protein ERJ75_000844100 [Trypanosoma vivax]|nr:hypothetical protein ERJ75_000844100 [Trypanosoma vivax]
MKREKKDGTVEVSLLLQRSLRCLCCPMRCALKACLTMNLWSSNGRTRREARHNSMKEESKEIATHLLGCPSLREPGRKKQLEDLGSVGFVVQCSTGSFLKKIFKLESTVAAAADEAESRTARAEKKHRSTEGMDITYPISATAKRVGECDAKGMRHRFREEDSTTRVICPAVPLCEARMVLGLRSPLPSVSQSRIARRRCRAGRDN